MQTNCILKCAWGEFQAGLPDGNDLMVARCDVHVSTCAYLFDMVISTIIISRLVKQSLDRIKITLFANTTVYIRAIGLTKHRILNTNKGY